MTRSYWDLITTTKHPMMAGQESIVKETLQTPAQIRPSRSDASVCEYTCEETGDEVVLMKDKSGRVIGFEKLNFSVAESDQLRVAFETVTV